MADQDAFSGRKSSEDVTPDPACCFSSSSVPYQNPSVHLRSVGISDVGRKARIAEIEVMILRTGQGDQAAFSALYAATSGKLFSVCLRILTNHAEAEDVLQEVFVMIWRNAHRYMVNGLSPMTWLITVARNRAISQLRKRKPPPSIVDVERNVADTSLTPEMSAIQKSERAQIDRCLLNLDRANADAIRGVYLEGRTYQDLADCAGVPINTMRTRLRRSLLKLRVCLSN